MRLRSAHATHESIRVCPHYCQFICVIYALPPFEGARQTHTHTYTTHTYTYTTHTYIHTPLRPLSFPCAVNCCLPPSVVKLFRASVLNSNQISLQIRHKSGRCCFLWPQLVILTSAAAAAGKGQVEAVAVAVQASHKF